MSKKLGFMLLVSILFIVSSVFVYSMSSFPSGMGPPSGIGMHQGFDPSEMMEGMNINIGLDVDSFTPAVAKEVQIPQELLETGMDGEFVLLMCDMAKESSQVFMSKMDSLFNAYKNIEKELDITVDTSELVAKKDELNQNVNKLCSANKDNFAIIAKELMQSMQGSQGMEAVALKIASQMRSQLEKKMMPLRNELESLAQEYYGSMGPDSPEPDPVLGERLNKKMAEVEALKSKVQGIMGNFKKPDINPDEIASKINSKQQDFFKKMINKKVSAIEKKRTELVSQGLDEKQLDEMINWMNQMSNREITPELKNEVQAKVSEFTKVINEQVHKKKLQEFEQSLELSIDQINQIVASAKNDGIDVSALEASLNRLDELKKQLDDLMARNDLNGVIALSDKAKAEFDIARKEYEKFKAQIK